MRSKRAIVAVMTTSLLIYLTSFYVNYVSYTRTDNGWLHVHSAQYRKQPDVFGPDLFIIIKTTLNISLHANHSEWATVDLYIGLINCTLRKSRSQLLPYYADHPQGLYAALKIVHGSQRILLKLLSIRCESKSQINTNNSGLLPVISGTENHI